MSDMTPFLGTDVPYRQVFYSVQAAGATAVWQVWDKPRGATMIYGIVIGGGGSGGNGFTGTTGTARGGGGGGGTSSINRFIAPAMLVPDRLYITVGKGGVIGVTNGTGSVISLSPNSATANIIINSGFGNNAATGTGSGNAAGGTAGATTIGTRFLGLFNFSSTGVSGATGGTATGAAGSAALMFNASGISPGAGGGGTTSADFAGGACTSPDTTLLPDNPGGAAGSNRGLDGYWIWGPHFIGSVGATGGGASDAGVGGAGGNGSYGGGGGGGGGGTTGGAGGKGGDGLVILVAL